MSPITLADVAAAVGAAPIEGPTVHAVCTDTRDLRPGCLFVALRGERHDGHIHLGDAAKGGAVAALVDRDVAPVPGLALVRVDDARRAMGRLATFVRRRFKGTVIAVAGSNGKTGTKHLIHAALSSKLRGSMSPKSFNNDIGVPVTLFAAHEDDDYVVLEMGTNHPGEIAHLSRLAEPDIAVVVSLGAEHLEFFGDLEGVARENAQVTVGLRSRGRVFSNGDDPIVVDAMNRDEGITFGFGGANDLVATHVVADLTGVTFNVGLDGPSFHVPLLGAHTASNALAAIGVGRHLGLTDDDIRRGLATVTGPAMRLQVQPAGPVTILNDAYNANPSSMQAALETLRDLPATRRIAVLGDMREMGDAAPAGHADVGRAAAGVVDRLVCAGPLSADIAAAATAAGLADITHLATTADAVHAVPGLLRAGDLVLVKASRGMKLEQVAEAIRAAFA